MTEIRGFPPISRPDARTLILGSMPSRESLAQRRYYAHPRNSFWPIVAGIFGLTGTDYQKMVDQLTGNGVAVWEGVVAEDDVFLGPCRRQSLPHSPPRGGRGARSRC